MHRNKHREATKMRRQRNTVQMKEQIKIAEKNPEQNVNKQSIRCRVQNTGYKDYQGT